MLLQKCRYYRRKSGRRVNVESTLTLLPDFLIESVAATDAGRKCLSGHLGRLLAQIKISAGNGRTDVETAFVQNIANISLFPNCKSGMRGRAIYFCK